MLRPSFECYECYIQKHSPLNSECLYCYYLIFSDSASIFSANIPYPFVESLTKTCVTAPTILPFCRIGEPLTSDVNMGQQIFLEKF